MAFMSNSLMWEHLLTVQRSRKILFPQNNAMTDLLIYIDNTASCSIIFNYEEKDVMLEKFWHDILMEHVQMFWTLSTS